MSAAGAPKEEKTLIMDWWRDFYDETFIRMSATFWPHEPELTRQEVADILNLLRPTPQERILDLCCGYGRHTIALTQAGYDIVGLDISPALLAKGRADARQLGAAATFVRGDIRAVPFYAAFDVALSLFTSFGYFTEEKDDQAMLHSVAAALKPGGRFLINVMNRDSLIARQDSQMWVEGNGILYLEEATIDPLTSRRQGTLIGLEGQRRITRQHNLRLYAAHELHAMIVRAGLQPLGVYGNLDGQDFDFDSHYVVILAQKP